MSDEGPLYTAGITGSTILARVDKPLRIRLEGNPSTGYLWRQRMPGGVAPPLTVSSTFRKAPIGMLGSEGVHIFRVVPTQTGDTTLTLDYVLPRGGGGEELIDTFTLHLHVRPRK